MPKPSSSLAVEFAKKLNHIEASRSRLEELYREGLVSERTLLQLYEGLFLKVYVAFESFIENLFVGLMLTGHGVVSSRRDIAPRAVVRSHRVIWNLLLGQRGTYIDWLPYSRTTDLGQKFFRKGRPFTDLSQPEKDLIAKAYKIRNAIGHGSRYSLKKFQDGVLPAGLPRKEQSPAGFLRGIFRVAPPQTRFEIYSSELLSISRKLSV